MDLSNLNPLNWFKTKPDNKYVQYAKQHADQDISILTLSDQKKLGKQLYQQDKNSIFARELGYSSPVGGNDMYSRMMQAPAYPNPMMGNMSTTSNPNAMMNMMMQLMQMQMMCKMAGVDMDVMGMFGSKSSNSAQSNRATQSTTTRDFDSDTLGNHRDFSNGLSGTFGRVYDKNSAGLDNISLNLTSGQDRDLGKFKSHYEANYDRYDAVAKKIGMPTKLVAALHWRESNGDFSKRMHDGRALGTSKRTDDGSAGGFSSWEESAVHAFKTEKGGIIKSMGITYDTKDPALLLTFAERYNGLGYQNKGLLSPYVFAGTTQYNEQGGKYVADGQFDRNHIDRQLGVAVMLQA